MNKTLWGGLVMFLSLILGRDVFSQQLIYTPINPSFGGSPFNAAWMLSEAQAQNGFTEGGGAQPSQFKSDPLADFKSSLNRQILSQLSRQLLTKTFGEGGQIKPGHFDLGDYSIDVTQSLEGLTILIFDVTTGAETSIIVPFF